MVEPSFVRGHGRRRARRTTVSPTLWTPFPFRPVHAWLVWCWPACVWSVYGLGAAAAAMLLVPGRLGRLMVGLVCVGSIALLPVVVLPHIVYAAGMSVSVLVSGVVVCPSVVLCSLLSLVGRVCIRSVVVFCCVRGHGRRRARRTTVSPTLWTPFPFRPVHAWLVGCWPACVWSVYGQVAAAAAVLLVPGRLGCLMVNLVCVGSIALLPVVFPPHVVYAAGMSVSVLVSGVVVCPSVVLCSLLLLVGRVCIGSVVAICCVRGHGRRRAGRTTVLPTRWAPFPFRPVHAWLVRRWPACVWSVYGQVVAAAGVWLVRGCCGRLMVGRVRVGFCCTAAVGLIVEPCLFSQHVCVCVGLWRLGMYKSRLVQFENVRGPRLQR